MTKQDKVREVLKNVYGAGFLSGLPRRTFGDIVINLQKEPKYGECCLDQALIAIAQIYEGGK